MYLGYKKEVSELHIQAVKSTQLLLKMHNYDLIQAYHMDNLT